MTTWGTPRAKFNLQDTTRGHTLGTGSGRTLPTPKPLALELGSRAPCGAKRFVRRIPLSGQISAPSAAGTQPGRTAPWARRRPGCASAPSGFRQDRLGGMRGAEEEQLQHGVVWGVILGEQ